MAWHEWKRPLGGRCVYCHDGYGEPIVCPACWERRISRKGIKQAFWDFYHHVREVKAVS